MEIKKEKVEMVICDKENQIKDLLTKIAYLSNIGHSFYVIVDPDDPEFKEKYGIDGDGWDKIREIRIDGEKYKTKEDNKKEKKEIEAKTSIVTPVPNDLGGDYGCSGEVSSILSKINIIIKKI